MLISGALGSINAKTTNLNGSIQSLGYVKAIALQNVQPRVGGNLISIAGQPQNEAETISLSFKDVYDLNVSAQNFSLKSIKANFWKDSDGQEDEIVALDIGKISIKGDFEPNTVTSVSIDSISVGGDFLASLVLSGNDVSQVTLGKVSIKGMLREASWLIEGDVGSLSMQAMDNSAIYVGVSNALTSLTGEQDDFIRQDMIKSLRISGSENGVVFENSEIAVWSLGKLYLPGGADGSGIIQYAIASSISEIPDNIEEQVVVSDSNNQSQMDHSDWIAELIFLLTHSSTI